MWYAIQEEETDTIGATDMTTLSDVFAEMDTLVSDLNTTIDKLTTDRSN